LLSFAYNIITKALLGYCQLYMCFIH